MDVTVITDSDGAEREESSWAPFRTFVRYCIDCVKASRKVKCSAFVNSRDKEWIEFSAASVAEAFQAPTYISTAHDAAGWSFVKKARESGRDGSLWFGYPLAVHGSGSSSKVFPVFLWRVDYSFEDSSLELRVNGNQILLNGDFLSNILKADDSDEFIGELGLFGEDGASPSLNELTSRLSSMDFGISVAEVLDPSVLANHQGRQQARTTGLYNRAIFAFGEGMDFTHGLERELNEILRAGDDELDQTALRYVFPSNSPPQPSTTADDAGLETPSFSEPIEPCSANSEQRAATVSAMRNPLTVLTGPPGTGKSQVVTNLLANQILRRRPTLLASFNHKAIDVVETRVNGLSSQRLLIRAGTSPSKQQRDLRVELLEVLNHVNAQAAHDNREYRDKLKLARRRAEEALDHRARIVAQVEDLDYRQTAAAADVQLWGRLLAFAGLPDDVHLPTGLAPLVNASGKLTDALEVLGEGTGCWDELLPFNRSAMRRRVRIALKKTPMEVRSLAGEPSSKLDADSSSDWSAFLARSAAVCQLIDLAPAYRKQLDLLAESSTMTAMARAQKSADDVVAEASQSQVRAHVAARPDLRSNWREAVLNYRNGLDAIVDGSLSGQQAHRYKKQLRLEWPTVAKVLPAWCVTNLSCSGAFDLEPAMFDLVVVDEASQCDIASAVPLLFRARRALVIGDTNQLRPISGLTASEDARLLALHGMDEVADLRYSYHSRSLFDLAASAASPSSQIALYDHYRSAVEIVGFSNRKWYGDRLRVCTNYSHLKGRAAEPRLLWTDSVGIARRPNGGSLVNREEVNAVADEVVRLIREARFDGTIGVVTPFRAQAREINLMLANRLSIPEQRGVDLLINTAHKFQGDERDLMIFSLGVGEGATDGQLRFLNQQGNLFNVALTRARSVLHVFGDKNYTSRCSVGYLREFADYYSRSGQKRWSGSFTPAEGPMEARLVDALRSQGLNPETQQRVAQYWLDIAFPEQKLGIEIDGKQFHARADGSRLISDVERDIRINALGWSLLRFWSDQVRFDRDRVVAQILQALEPS